MFDLSIVYYTSNHLEKTNPYFLKNTQDQLIEAADGLPIIIVSQKPMLFGPNSMNICDMKLGGRSHLNIYRQILIGARQAKTKFVAMAEDDILYSPEHFRYTEYIKNPQDDVFYYDMNKVSLFTWVKPAMFSFRFKREVVNQLICNREFLIDAMEERFKKAEELMALGWEERKIIKYWGDPGRYEDILGVTVRKTRQESCKNPSIVYSHEHAYGYEANQGKKKRLGDLRIIELLGWGRADKYLKLYYEGQ